VGRQRFGIILGYAGLPIMNAPTTPAPRTSDPEAVATLARTIYREFRAGGFNERDVMALAGELLDLVARDVRNERSTQPG
jgi:hypothetical protein